MEIAKAAALLVEWFLGSRRDLPWRIVDSEGKRDPYRVWVSETMLQQTQVETVRERYVAWMERFPDMPSLSMAREEDVLRLWQGLGYYSRARNLWRTAKKLGEQGKHVLPSERSELEALPGIGPYTAGAILSLAHGQAAAILDGNLIRVFSRFNGWDFLPNTAQGKKTYWDEAKRWCEAGPSHLVNESLMELGALVCRPMQPKCAECPLAFSCKAKTLGVEKFPPRVAKAYEDWVGLALVCRDELGHVWLRQDVQAPFLKQQEGFPLYRTEREIRDAAEGARLALGLKTLPAGAQASWGLGEIKHSITRYRIRLRIVLLNLQRRPLDWGGHWHAPQDLGQGLVHSLGLKIWKRALDPFTR